MPDFNISDRYYQTLARIESGNRPNVKAKTSSASGLFQFIRETGIRYGLPWGNDASRAFGGASVSPEQQLAAVQRFTQDNASILNRAGIPINDATLYAAHFLGAGGATNILRQNPNSLVSSHTSRAVIRANPFLRGMTVEGFFQWLGSKTGVDPHGGGSEASPLALDGTRSETPLGYSIQPWGSDGMRVLLLRGETQTVSDFQTRWDGLKKFLASK